MIYQQYDIPITILNKRVFFNAILSPVLFNVNNLIPSEVKQYFIMVLQNSSAFIAGNAAMYDF